MKKITIAELNKKLSYFDKVDLTINDKLTYGIKKNKDRAASATKTLSEKNEEELQAIRINLCSVDDKGVIILNPSNNFMYTRENQLKAAKELTAKQQEYLSTEVEIEPFEINIEDEGCKRFLTEFDDFDREQIEMFLKKKAAK